MKGPFELKPVGWNHHCFLIMESSPAAASFLPTERIQIVAVAVEKTFGVAVRTPVLVVEEISDLPAAAQMTVADCQSLSVAETAGVALLV